MHEDSGSVQHRKNNLLIIDGRVCLLATKQHFTVLTLEEREQQRIITEVVWATCIHVCPLSARVVSIP